jgi:hypothetical protein
MEDETPVLIGSEIYPSIRRVDSKQGLVVPKNATIIESEALKALYEENEKLKAKLRERQLQEIEEAEIAKLKAENAKLQERLAQPKVGLDDFQNVIF